MIYCSSSLHFIAFSVFTQGLHFTMQFKCFLRYWYCEIKTTKIKLVSKSGVKKANRIKKNKCFRRQLCHQESLVRLLITSLAILIALKSYNESQNRVVR